MFPLSPPKVTSPTMTPDRLTFRVLSPLPKRTSPTSQPEERSSLVEPPSSRAATGARTTAAFPTVTEALPDAPVAAHMPMPPSSAVVAGSSAEEATTAPPFISTVAAPDP